MTQTLAAARLNRVMGYELDFIASDEFDAPGVSETDFDVESPRSPANPPPAGLPSHLAEFCRSELLDAETERALFRRMNYLNYRANRLRDSLSSSSPNSETLDEIERLHRAAIETKDRILRANLRLVMSIVKKLVTPQVSFDDLLSDGVFSLMQAAEKFDYRRGFRFSTYAYRAISRNAFRAVKAKQREAARWGGDVDSSAEPSGPGLESRQQELRLQSIRRELAGLVNQLDRRERFIIRGRHALGGHRRVKTFQRLADSLSISKERARQLEQAAVKKLRRMASDVNLGDLAELAFA